MADEEDDEQYMKDANRKLVSKLDSRGKEPILRKGYKETFGGLMEPGGKGFDKLRPRVRKFVKEYSKRSK